MATDKITFDPEDRKQFVAIRERLHGECRLGGSDVGTAAGQNKWKSRRRFYEELTGGVAAPDISTKQSVKDGILCEALVAKKFEERTGKKVHRVNAIQTSAEAPHLFASIDRKVENEDAGLECKTANGLNWEAFKGGRLPDSYVKQIKTYMKVTGYRTWYAYVWVMGCAEYCYVFTLDEMEKPAWCDTIVRLTQMELDECEDIAAEFFERYVTPRCPPECDGSADEADVLKELFPEADARVGSVTLTETTEADLDRIEAMNRAIKADEAEIERIENKIKGELGEAAEGVVGSRRVTWKNNKASEKTDWKAVCADMEPPAEVVRAHTRVVPGARVLRIGKAKAA